MQELTSGNKTIGEIVAADFRTAKIFEKHGIDFCCGGKITLETICAEKGLELVSLSRELEAVQSETTDLT